MIVVLRTSARHLSAISLTGWTRPVEGTSPAKRGVVVLKGAFTLSGAPGEALETEPAAAPPEIVVADEGAVIPDEDEDRSPKDFDLRYEADTALEKAHADVVVKGWVGSSTGGLDAPGSPGAAVATVNIAGDVWARRTVGLPGPDADTGRNLFGWLSKARSPRRIEAPKKQPVPDSYHAGFNNFSRRGPDFSAPSQAGLPDGAEVTVRKSTAGGTSTDFAFRLPASLAHTARLRAYCGHGVDKPRRWRVVERIPMLPDTLIVDPEASAVTILWRAGWSLDLAPGEAWRMVEVLPGGVD